HKLTGEQGKDVIGAGKGNDFSDGGAGDDSIVDIAGVATVAGGEGNDVAKVSGGGVVAGRKGDDILVSPGGALLYGEDGNDNLQAAWCSGGAGNDTVAGLLG